MKEVPIWEKSNLTLEEAAAYTGIGISKIRQLSDREDCEFVLWVGTKRLIKRRKFDEYIDMAYSVWQIYKYVSEIREKAPCVFGVIAI